MEIESNLIGLLIVLAQLFEFSLAKLKNKITITVLAP